MSRCIGTYAKNRKQRLRSFASLGHAEFEIQIGGHADFEI
jgi:hypothetical protein